MRAAAAGLGVALVVGVSTAWARPDIREVEARVIALEQRATQEASRPNTQIELVTQLQQLQEDMRALRGQIEESANRLEQIEKRQRELYLDLDRRLGALEGGAPGADGAQASAAPPPAPPSAPGPAETAPPARPAVNSTPAPVQPAPPRAPTTAANTPAGVERPGNSSAAPAADEQTLYRAAYEELRAGRYEAAVTGFRTMLDKYPDGDLADNAVYWTGESYYVTRQYDAAMAEFQRVVSEFPRSPKTADAMLKIGYVHYNRREYPAARSVFTELTQNWPATAAARLAESQLRRMQEQGF